MVLIWWISGLSNNLNVEFDLLQSLPKSSSSFFIVFTFYKQDFLMFVGFVPFLLCHNFFFCIVVQSLLLYLGQVPLVSIHITLSKFFSSTLIFLVISSELHAVHEVLYIFLCFIRFAQWGTLLIIPCLLSVCQFSYCAINLNSWEQHILKLWISCNRSGGAAHCNSLKFSSINNESIVGVPSWVIYSYLHVLVDGVSYMLDALHYTPLAFYTTVCPN